MADFTEAEKLAYGLVIDLIIETTLVEYADNPVLSLVVAAQTATVAKLLEEGNRDKFLGAVEVMEIGTKVAGIVL